MYHDVEVLIIYKKIIQVYRKYKSYNKLLTPYPVYRYYVDQLNMSKIRQQWIAFSILS